MSKTKKMAKLARFGLAVMAALALAFTAGVYAQEADTAYVPFIVNVDAAVKAELGGNIVSMDVTAGEADTLKIPLWGTSSVRHRPQNALNNAPVITSNQRGRVSINLPVQNYGIAEISLYSVNGRRILRTNASASEAAKNISRPNLVSGVYLLTVKGANGHSFTNRLTHRGGGLNINVAFGGENISPVSPITVLSRQTVANASGDWTITVSADGYIDSVYTLDVVEGENPLQNITLRQGVDLCAGFVDGTEREHRGMQKKQFCDKRDGTKYVYVTIGAQTWMAENLNYDVPNNDTDVCFNNAIGYCNIFGRLYDWAMAMTACPDGWHLPGRDEWTELVSNSGYSYLTLMAKGIWNSFGLETDIYGFSALPGGYGTDVGFGGSPHYEGYWWTSSTRESIESEAYYRLMDWQIDFSST
ncbi:MAG: T9SS type A sorting domain-containing protein, partial [Chitinispirillales bacterium]|nr:T9SS type A sorting domain-containing protein [Chitinispirillales bacterium]